MIELDKALIAQASSGVELVIVGGVAATAHGSTAFTYDLDICYSRADANLERLAKALAPYHPRPRVGAPLHLGRQRVAERLAFHSSDRTR